MAQGPERGEEEEEEIQYFTRGTRAAGAAAAASLLWIEIVHRTALGACFSSSSSSSAGPFLVLLLASYRYLPACCQPSMDIHEAIAGKVPPTGVQSNCILLMLMVMQKIKKNYQQSTGTSLSKEESQGIGRIKGSFCAFWSWRSWKGQGMIDCDINQRDSMQISFIFEEIWEGAFSTRRLHWLFSNCIKC